MRITNVRVAEAPIASQISNAVIDFSKMNVTVVEVTTDRQVDGEAVVGYGFHSNGRYAQKGLLEARLLPRLLDADPEKLLDADGIVDPVACRDTVMQNEKPGGHGDRAVAVGALDMALWDLASKVAQRPAFRHMHHRFGLAGAPAESAWVYAAGGYYHPGKGVEALQDEMRGYLDMGYCDVKMKIGGATLAEDLRRIEAVLGILPNGVRLAVDANGRFDVRTALDYAAALSDYELLWYEEPCPPLDYLGHAVVADHYPGIVATGENLFSVDDVRNLVRYAGLRTDTDVLQMDPTLSYGIPEFAEMLQVLERAGWSSGRCCPHGGHQLNLAATAGFHLGGCESYPGVFEPFGGFADSTPIEDGRVRLPEVPGLGVEDKPALHDLLRRTFA
ncbi:MAG: mandelate racemase [Streptosporangiales bacterium]|nr:mandelate racemase [Streptosporangiales bacterium]